MNILEDIEKDYLSDNKRNTVYNYGKKINNIAYNFCYYNGFYVSFNMCTKLENENTHLVLQSINDQIKDNIYVSSIHHQTLSFVKIDLLDSEQKINNLCLNDYLTLLKLNIIFTIMLRDINLFYNKYNFSHYSNNIT